MKVAAALVVVALLIGCGDDDAAMSAGAPAAEWVTMPDSPLSARYGTLAVGVGDEVLLVGGYDDDPCPPNADCAFAPEARRDGAAFDVVDQTWRPLAPAPSGVAYDASVAVLEDVVYLLSDHDLLAYDVGDDTWTEPTPPGPEPRRLVATHDALVAYVSSEEHGDTGDLVLDPATGAWSPLPADPMSPSYDRTMVWTGDRIVLIDVELVEQPNSVEPSLYRAASLDLGTGTWTELARSDVVASSSIWMAIGEQVVNPTAGTLDGGEVNNWGRDVPAGGILDLAAGEWQPLPDRDDRFGRARLGTTLVDGDRVITADGWVLDLGDATWHELPATDDRADAASAIAAGSIVVWGGVHREDGSVEADLLADGWMLRVS